MHQEIVTLRQTLKTALRHGWLDRLPDFSEPYRSSPKISHRAWFSPEEYKKLYEATRKRTQEPKKKGFKIIDQIWTGLKRAKVLVAELTGRNPNVLYELGLAHALHKPVVLISSNEADVPFDVRHVRVIYYELTDPFWGEKLIAKVAENVVSAIKNPNEAIRFPKE